MMPEFVPTPQRAFASTVKGPCRHPLTFEPDALGQLWEGCRQCGRWSLVARPRVAPRPKYVRRRRP
jgi:hypothetical protein